MRAEKDEKVSLELLMMLSSYVHLRRSFHCQKIFGVIKFVSSAAFLDMTIINFSNIIQISSVQNFSKEYSHR